MNTHYIPRLLLKYFAEGNRVNVYDAAAASITRKKIKNTFSMENAFDEELENAFATKLEGPFGDLLSHKLLSGEKITINRRENLLMRKFMMINSLRSPLANHSWKEIIEITKIQEHPSVKMTELLCCFYPELREQLDSLYSKDTYISDLKRAMDIESLEDISEAGDSLEISQKLKLLARNVMAATVAFWDCADSGQEFIFPRLQGISEMDYKGILYKCTVLEGRKAELENEWLPKDMNAEIMSILHGSMMFSDNYGIYPLSPTRALVCFSPYFKAFFPMKAANSRIAYPPLLDNKQFEQHFYKPMRLELFKPCANNSNSIYHYSVKQLTAAETQKINALMMNTETEEFVFHDYEKIRGSFKYYDNEAVFAGGKKYDFRHLE